MQCSQPFGSTGFSNNIRQTYPCNYAFPQVPQPSLCPEVIGEGEVASVVFPDGTIRLYFIPLNKRVSPYPCYQNYSPYCNDTGVYYVRGISNPITPAIFNQQCQKVYASPFSRPCYNSDYNINIPPPGFQLKFHNDCWTSTTDLHYFFPCLRRCDWFHLTQPKGCVAVQVDIPDKESTICHREIACAKPCIRFKSKEENNSENESDISCEHFKQKHNPKKERKHKVAKKKSDVICKCHDVDTSDKSMATVADKCNSCVGSSERNTQTSKSGVCGAETRSDVKTELWFPKTSRAGELRIKSSEKILGVYETGSSATCCCSDTDYL